MPQRTSLQKIEEDANQMAKSPGTDHGQIVSWQSETASNQDIDASSSHNNKKKFNYGATLSLKKNKLPAFKERMPTLSETLDMLRRWFSEAIERCQSLDQVEIEHTAVADFLVFKGLFTERETGIKYILKVLEIKLDDSNQSVKICYN